MNAELVKALRSPEIREKLTGLGMEAVGGTPEQYSAHIKEELAKYAPDREGGGDQGGLTVQGAMWLVMECLPAGSLPRHSSLITQFSSPLI